MRLHSLTTTILSIVRDMKIMIWTFFSTESGEAIFVTQYPLGNPMFGSISALAYELKWEYELVLYYHSRKWDSDTMY